MIPASALHAFCADACHGDPNLVANAEAAFAYFNQVLAGAAPDTLVAAVPQRPALTAAQRALFDFIVQFTAEHGVQPSQAEMAQHCGYQSHNAVAELLSALEKKRYIQRQPGKRARSLKILQGAPT